jgi:hypothetical protein
LAGFDERLPRIVIITAAKIEHRPHNASRWRAALKLTDPLKFEVIAKPQTNKGAPFGAPFRIRTV